MELLINGMVFLGSALMVYNIYYYVRYLRRLLEKKYWESGRIKLYFPLVLLIMFLAGYLVVGIFGKPDIVMSAILFFGSVYVSIMLGVLQSITRRVEEFERVESELRAAEETSRAKTRFLSHMSHEIRTPMNAIIGMNAIALKNPDLPEETRVQLEKIDASSQHMLALINDILDISRIESGTVELKSEKFRFSKLIDQVNEIIRIQCMDKELIYECRMDCLTEEICLGDPMKLKQILINILGNAVKFTPPGGNVVLTVDAGVTKNCRCPVRFIISDTGAGIDEDYLPYIFDAFSQEDDSSTNRYGGSGLGMAITKSLVELMGGSISVESKKGEGSIFTVDVTLDIVHTETGEFEEVSADKPEETDADDDGFTLAGKHILFAEDIELNAEILADFLEMEDITSDWAEDGRIAVEMFKASKEYEYDAILMDMRMPVMDGLTATEKIRELDRPDAKHIPIIALTANAFEEDVEKSLAAGMDAHLSKPIDSDTLLKELRRQTRNRNYKRDSK